MSTDRALAALARPGAWLDRSGDLWMVRAGTDRRRRPVMRVEAEAVARLKREPGLLPRTEGGWVLAGAGEGSPGRLLAEVLRPGPDGREMRASSNRGESPIAWLARRKGPDGLPWLSRAQVMAAERLREDFEQAGVQGRLTMDWLSGPRDRTARGPAGPPRASSARRRVRKALEAAGPGLREMLEQVCLYGSAMQAAERALGAPARSGKTTLRLALDRLARHYRLI
jgi:hypothetical protein